MKLRHAPCARYAGVIGAAFYAATILCGMPAAAEDEKVVAEVRILNNKTVSSATILSKIKTRKGMAYSPAVVNEDLKRLYALGYFEDIAVDVEDTAEGYIVSFVVLEEPIIDSITFEGNKALKDDLLKKEISLAEGEMLDGTSLTRDVTSIKKLYEGKGFQLTRVDYEVDIDEEKNRAQVTFLINEKQRIRVEKLEFFGNYSIPDKELRRLMVTKPQFFWFIQPGYFKAEEFEADIERLVLYYKDHGFLDVTVDPEIEYACEGTLMYISVTIEEGKQYLVGDITVEGNEKFPESEIRETLTTESGSYYSQSAMREDVMNIQQYYFDRGYMDAVIRSDMVLDPATGNIDVTYAIDEHELIYIDKVRIQGNTKTRDVVIRRELRAYPGEPFNGAEIRRSKERLYNLGYFEEVVLDTAPSPEPDKKDLVVEVKEAKTGEFSFGGGYSSVDKLIGFVQVNQRNFDALNFPTFTGAGQKLNVRAEFGSVRQNYIVSWTDPWIGGYPLLFGFDAYQTEHKKTSDLGYLFDEKRRGGDLRLGKEFTEYFRGDAMYKLENIDISNVSDNASTAIKDEEGDNWLSRLMFSLKYDTRDNIYTPTRGFVLAGSVENIGGFIGGDKDFIKYGISTENFLSVLDRRLVFSLSNSLFFAENYGDTDNVPIYERYYAGGAQTLRGYKERYVGPRDDVTNEPIGGNVRYLASLEATFPLVEKMIKGAVFVDAGEVWSQTADIFSSNLKFGSGLGVRVKTPLGPVKLDYAWPLSDNQGDEKKGRFYFSMSHGF